MQRYLWCFNLTSRLETRVFRNFKYSKGEFDYREQWFYTAWTKLLYLDDTQNSNYSHSFTFSSLVGVTFWLLWLLMCELNGGADISTDGRWCYIVYWVVPYPASLKIDWESLKTRLLSACPSCLFSYHFNQHSTTPSPPPIYVLKVWCVDQKGLLHGNQLLLWCLFWLVTTKIEYSF